MSVDVSAAAAPAVASAARPLVAASMRLRVITTSPWRSLASALIWRRTAPGWPFPMRLSFSRQARRIGAGRLDHDL